MGSNLAYYIWYKSAKLFYIVIYYYFFPVAAIILSLYMPDYLVQVGLIEPQKPK